MSKTKCSPQTISIDGTDYVRANDVSAPPAGEEYRITVVDNRGLMFVGWIDLTSEERFLTIRNARCVIYWGTDEHVAQLVAGPREDTRLGAMADVVVDREKIVFSYRADEGGWDV